MTDPGQTNSEPTGASPIEVGSSITDGTIRYWKAKEGVTKGEVLLGSQISSMSRLMTSATSILGWSVTISLALTAAIASALAPPPSSSGNPNPAASWFLSHLLWPAVAAEILLLIAAICCVRVLWPATWRAPGHDPALVLSAPYDTELEVLESMASGYAEAARYNGRALSRLEGWLRTAWASFAAAPIIGLLLYAVLFN